MRVEWTGTINRPPVELFDYLADARNEQTWHPQARRVEKISPDPVGPGAAFRGDYKGAGTMTYTIDMYDPPRQLIFRGIARSMPFTATLTLTPAATGTRLSDRMEMETRGIFKLLAPLMRPVMQRQTAAAMLNLKRTVETAGALSREETA